jgi:hypothetical protein
MLKRCSFQLPDGIYSQCPNDDGFFFGWVVSSALTLYFEEVSAHTDANPGLTCIEMNESLLAPCRTCAFICATTAPPNDDDCMSMSSACDGICQRILLRDLG